MRARAQLRLSRGATSLFTHTTAVAVRRNSALLLIAAVLCAGCAGPLGRSNRGSCSMPVDSCTECDAPACDTGSECAGPACDHCGGLPGVGLGIPFTVGHAVGSLVCWPCDKCRHVINFCAPDDYRAPPPVPGPGRLHPVPTHPVFQHSCEPETSPVQ